MPQSLSHILVHLIFSTKHRAPLLTKQIQDELHPYLAGVLHNIECTSLRVGGLEDHIHALFGLSRTISVASVAEKLKTSSSKWMKNKGFVLDDFHWQNGYGAFSVGPTNANAVVRYIENQSEHHRHRTFQEEYRAFLEKYHIQYDERYVWD